MQAYTIQKIVHNLARFINFEGKLNKKQTMAVWAYYILQIFIFQVCLIISIIEPQMKLSDAFANYPQIQLSLIAIRFTISGLYLVTKSTYITPVIKLMQIFSVFFILTGTWFTMTPLIVEFLAQMYLTLRKQKRRINFDSRLQSKYFGIKVLTIYIALLVTFYTPNNEIHQNSTTVFFCALFYYGSSCNDKIYSYRTKQVLRNFALAPFLISIYFKCLPLLPVISDFSLGVHVSLSIGIFLIFILTPILNKYSYTHQILFTKMLNIQSRDKLEFLWALIYFSENANHEDMVCFVKNHQAKCFNALCPLNFKKDIQDFQSLDKFIGIYLRNSLQRSASESDQMRRLFIFYRQIDDPKIMHLLHQSDIHEKMETLRIKNYFQSFNDISLEYDQMKEIQAKTLSKVKQYLIFYDHFLLQISKSYINMQNNEQIIKKLLQLRVYFLSFTSQNLSVEQRQQKLKKEVNQKPINDNKLQESKILINKLTHKALFLVNFMRKFYFNLPVMQKELIQKKDKVFVNQDIEQQPIIILSAERYNLSKVLNWNTSALKKLNYSIKEMEQKFVNDFLPKTMHAAHEKIFMKSSVQMQFEAIVKQFNLYLFIFSKTQYVQIFTVTVMGQNNIGGNRWIIGMQMSFQYQACIVIDQQDFIVGYNKTAIEFGFTLDNYGHKITEEMHEKLFKQKSQATYLQKGYSPLDGLKIPFASNWKLISTTPNYPQMRVYYIFLIEYAVEQRKSELPEYKMSSQIYEYTPDFNKDFQFKFDAYNLKYTNYDVTPPNSQKNIQQHWSEIDQDNKQIFRKVTQVNKKINYGDNIHEMIYFDSKLEFKQNYEIVTEFQTHPNYLQGKQKSLNQTTMDIKKQNFMQNIAKIKLKNPFFIYQLIVMIIITGKLLICDQTVKFVQYNSLYSQLREKQLILAQLTNRKNTIQDIGSLAIYNKIKVSYPNVWNQYLKNAWTYQILFVKIESINANLNSLNVDIGALTTKVYQFNNQSKTIASLFSSLSISASSQSAGAFDQINFVQTIVNDISVIESLILGETLSYYDDKKSSCNTSIFMMDVVVCGLGIIILVFFHFILSRLHTQRCQIFKSLTVIQEQEIDKIHQNLRQHQQKINSNQLDLINDNDYKERNQSHNISHAKAFYAIYFRKQITVIYATGLLLLIVIGSLFFVSSNLKQNMNLIQLVDPFNKVFGEQRYLMEKLYLKLMIQVVSATELLNQAQDNIRSFQAFKNKAIANILTSSLSSNYVKFFNQLWFNPCSTFNITSTCDALLYEIITSNLDYGYIFILTQTTNVINYRQLRHDHLMVLSVELTTELDQQITLCLQKINFLLFNLMTQVQTLFSANFKLEIQVLFKSMNQKNLLLLFGILIITAAIVVFLSVQIYRLRNVVKDTLDMIMTVIPFQILMRNRFFIIWYKQKFKEIY